jgi:hypothetical protein
MGFLPLISLLADFGFGDTRQRRMPRAQFERVVTAVRERAVAQTPAAYVVDRTRFGSPPFPVIDVDITRPAEVMFELVDGRPY